MATQPAVDDTSIADTDVTDSRLYECAVLYPYSLTQKEEQDIVREIEGLFAEAGAKLVAKDAWGRRGVAYAIKGFKEVNVIIYHYDLDPAKVRELDQQLRIHKGVLRHLFVKPPKGYQILKWSELYEKWMKERESVEQIRARERETKLQEQVARKAQQKAKDAVIERKKTKPAEAAAAPLREDLLTEKLEKLISDDTLDI